MLLIVLIVFAALIGSEKFEGLYARLKLSSRFGARLPAVGWGLLMAGATRFRTHV